MKHLIYIALLILHFSATANKYAVIFANSDYELYNEGWTNTLAAKDTEIVLSALMKNGFVRSNIAVVYNFNKSKFLQAFKTELLNKVKPGDVVFIHYSGHGQKIANQANSDYEIDDYDEAIVAIDAPIGSEYEPEYTGEKHIRDDEIGVLLDSLRDKLGNTGHVFMSIDACMSGSITKGLKIHSTPGIRGTDLKWSFTNSKLSNTSTGKPVWGLFKSNDSMASLFVISASSQNQFNYELKDQKCGSLSYALSKVLSNRITHLSYKELFERIKNEMCDLQVPNVPQYEGDVYGEVLSGRQLEIVDYFEVTGINLKTREAFVNAGEIDGLYNELVIHFYPSSVFSTADLKNTTTLATGRVKCTALNRSVVVIDTQFAVNGLKGAHAIVDGPFGAFAESKIALVPSLVNTFLDSLFQQKANLPIIAVVDSSIADLIIRPSESFNASDGKYDLIENSKSLLGKNLNIDSLLYRIMAYGRCKLLRSMNTSPTPAVTFNLKRCFNCSLKPDGNFSCKSAFFRNRIQNGLYILHETDTIGFWIKNNLKLKDDRDDNYLHFLLFEISDQHLISIVLPKPIKEANGILDFGECQVENGKTVGGDASHWELLKGTYEFILAVSSEPFNQESIVGMYTDAAIWRDVSAYLSYKPASENVRLAMRNTAAGQKRQLVNINGVYIIKYTCN